MANIETPVPTWSEDAKTSDIMTEVRKAFSSLTASLNTVLNQNPGNGSLLGAFPTSSSGSIFKTTTNSNGTALQFSDGTMIQYGEDTSGASGAVNITLPISFIDTSYKVFATISALNSSFMFSVDIAVGNVQQFTILKTYLILGSSTSGFSSSNCGWFAIGKWK
jgi:hypothetical protein